MAAGTREGYVYERLLRKLETESQAPNGPVSSTSSASYLSKPPCANCS
ncbi:MAG: hypothetical protein M5U34_27300 [Chloroflexi bacterium]|nr:hypothetical protein [Chloroflexota bacterium]